MSERADDHGGDAFKAALATLPNKTVALPGTRAVLRIERSDVEPAIVMDLYDGCLRRADCTRSVFELHKSKARMDLAWNVLFKLMSDAMNSDPPGISIKYGDVMDGKVEVWFAYKVSDQVTMRASFELSPVMEDETYVADRVLEIMLAQCRESASERKLLLERIASLERQAASVVHEMDRIEAAASPVPSPMKIRPQHKRARRARVQEVVPKGTRLKEGF